MARARSTRDPIVRLQDYLDRELSARAGLAVLEAGCGSAGHFRFGAGAHLTGIDISPLQLARNTRLDVAIEADLETHLFAPESFDVIVSWNVFEHLERPRRALDRLVPALRPGGQLILGLPSVDSVKGLLTRLLPHEAHVFIYRHLHHNLGAGRGDTGPFRTRFRAPASPRGLERYAREQGLELAYRDDYDAEDVGYFEGKNRLARLGYATLRWVAGALTLGRLGPSECVLVLRKPRQFASTR